MTEPLPRRILVGVSCAPDLADPPLLKLAEADRHTLEQALWLASRIGASLRVIHVTDFVDEALVNGSTDIEALVRASLDGELAAFRGQAGEAGVVLSTAWARGRPWYEIIQEAHRWEAGLVMLSPRRDDIRAFRRLLHGSTSRRVLQKAPCAVWIVDPGRPVQIDRILALVDRTDVAAEVIAAAGALADVLGAEKHLLHCLDYPADVALRRLPDADRALRAYHDQERAAVARELDAHTAGRGHWRIHLEDGWVGSGVPRVVQATKAQLAVLSSHSRSGLAGMLGTTAETLLERAPVSTWVLRPASWVSPIEPAD